MPSLSSRVSVASASLALFCLVTRVFSVTARYAAAVTALTAVTGHMRWWGRVSAPCVTVLLSLSTHWKEKSY